MAKVDLQLAAAVSPAEVYEALRTLHRRPELDPTILEIDAPEAPLAEGATFNGSGILSGTEEAFNGLVTAIEPERFVGLGFNYGNGARLHEQWRLSPTPSGTFVRYHAELSLPGGLFGRVLDAVLVGGGFKKQREAVLAHVKAALERDAD